MPPGGLGANGEPPNPHPQRFGAGRTAASGGAGELAAHDLHPTVADGRFAKPVDRELIARLCAEHDLVVTIEENVLAGGFGAAVVEYADRPGRARILKNRR